jgi:cobalt/nickel transport system permease protein
MLGMHMANELLTPQVAAGFLALTAVLLALAARGARSVDPARVPLMGVMGAFVFAAQMINFPVLPGTSGHLGGGVLLAILLGPHAASLIMASILIVQCLIFQDGGLLALGTNILNLGILPCYLGYGVFRLLAGPRRRRLDPMAMESDGGPPGNMEQAPGAGRVYIAIFAATLVGVTAGAAMVPTQAAMSGVLAVPLRQFLLAMIGLHLLIGLVEAIITFGIIAYLVRVRPQALPEAGRGLAGVSGAVGGQALAASFLIVALLLGGIGSLFASQWPDALEVLTEAQDEGAVMVTENPNPLIHQVSEWQERTAPLPDYHLSSLSGVGGALLTLGLVWLIGRLLHRRKQQSSTAQ